eukprot:500868-Hanusia_phi.AAC.1
MQRAPPADLPSLRGGRMAVSWDGRAAALAELRLSIAVSFCSSESVVAETRFESFLVGPLLLSPNFIIKSGA